MRKSALCFLVLTTAAIPNVRANDSTNVDKSQYTLLNPTPEDAMRYWYTDHAGQSPYTIDAGHFEANLTALQYGYYHRSQASFGETAQQYAIGETEIKVGLLNDLDFELSIVPYDIFTDQTHSGAVEHGIRRTGVEDLETRVKWNLWGNDAGASSLAVGGLVEWPTGTGSVGREQFEGGVFVDFQAHLPSSFEFRIHANALSIADYDSNNNLKREYSFQNEISLSHPIIDSLEGYVIFNTYAFTTPDRDWDGTIGAGLNYRIKKNMELFAGMGFGVNGTAYGYNPFFGVSARF
jgi:Putative MetA-pathway of phenol degradation